MPHYDVDTKNDVVYLVHESGYREALGKQADVWPPAENIPSDPVEILQGKVDLLLTARIQDGSLTTAMVQAASLPDEIKAQLADKIATVKK